MKPTLSISTNSDAAIVKKIWLPALRNAICSCGAIFCSAFATSILVLRIQQDNYSWPLWLAILTTPFACVFVFVVRQIGFYRRLSGLWLSILVGSVFSGAWTLWSAWSLSISD